jgi:hypothetical protein
MTSAAQRSKLRKLLALASNNPNRSEAEAALLKAQALMTEALPTVPESSPITEALLSRDTSPWFQRLASVIATNFRVHVLLDYGENAVNFVGARDDLAVAVYVAQTARRCAQQLAAAWWLENAEAPMAAQEEFLHGFVSGLRDQFSAQVAARQYAVALVPPPGIDHYLREQQCGTVEAPVPPVTGTEAYNRGAQAGAGYYVSAQEEEPT